MKVTECVSDLVWLSCHSWSAVAGAAWWPCGALSWCCAVVDVSSISLSQYHVHVLTSVMKSFFREMKEPLMTFALYQDFIQAAGLVTA